jgi:hypothetical protein
MEWYVNVSKSEGLTDDEFNEGFDNYAMMSVRIIGLNGDAGFELASPEDPSEEVREKFLGYLETDNIRLIRKLERMIIESDKPHDPEKAPNADNLDPEV